MSVPSIFRHNDRACLLRLCATYFEDGRNWDLQSLPIDKKGPLVFLLVPWRMCQQLVVTHYTRVQSPVDEPEFSGQGFQLNHQPYVGPCICYINEWSGYHCYVLRLLFNVTPYQSSGARRCSTKAALSMLGPSFLATFMAPRKA